MKRVAVVGSGVAGLGAAWTLARSGREVAITLFEADARLGGHAHTVDVTLPGSDGQPVTHGVDTGFLVFNERTYPRLIRWFDELGVAQAPSEMSFSVQVPAQRGAVSGVEAWLAGLQWCGSSLGSVFVQRGNLISPRFWGMLLDLLRFNRLCTAMALRGEDAALAQPIGEFLDQHRFGQAFRQGYLLPMIACIWSCPVQQMLRFPVGTLIRFCHNHGLLQVINRPQWFTVRGGSREYVRRVASSLSDVRLSTPVRSVVRLSGGPGREPGVVINTDQGVQHFDEVILACHSDQALALLGQGATEAERAVLGAIGYHRNRAVLHTDATLLPADQKAWAAWNYERSAPGLPEAPGVCLHYLINTLQPLPWATPVVVSLNPLREPRPQTVLGEFDYAHPVFDLAAVQAQQRLPEIQGRQGVWFCGAWAGYGFHEDGLHSGQHAAMALLASLATQAAARQEAAA
jgi:predicted NAD/FAD-binding protein